MPYEKPLPDIDVWNRHFMEACAEERLIAQRCATTGAFWLPPSPVSPFTRNASWEWVELSGYGTIWSFINMHQVYFKSFADDVPYNVCQIKLDEGPFLLSNVIGCAIDDIKIDAAVKVEFFRVSDTIAIPKFRLVE